MVADATDAGAGLGLLARAGVVHLAAVSAHGAPLVWAVEASLEGAVLHVRHRGDGLRDAEGRPVVVSASEVHAALPSLVLASSVRAEGVLERIHDEARVRVSRVLHREDLGGHLAPAERLRVVEELWRRGAPGDVAAAGLVLARSPELAPPSFLRPAPELHARGVRLHCALGPAALDEAVELLAGVYWLTDVPRATIRAAVQSSSAVVAATEASGRVVAFARALSDGRTAWIYDVIVAPALRGARVGSAVMQVLLAHPAVRDVRHVRLTTRDAMTFYRRLGFCDLAEAPRPRATATSTDMIRIRRASRASREETP